eukprot:IDg21217t1
MKHTKHTMRKSGIETCFTWQENSGRLCENYRRSRACTIQKCEIRVQKAHFDTSGPGFISMFTVVLARRPSELFHVSAHGENSASMFTVASQQPMSGAADATKEAHPCAAASSIVGDTGGEAGTHYKQARDDALNQKATLHRSARTASIRASAAG